MYSVNSQANRLEQGSKQSKNCVNNELGPPVCWPLQSRQHWSKSSFSATGLQQHNYGVNAPDEDVIE